MHAVILAGGKGTRLRPYTSRLPKPLVPIGDEFSILEIVLSQLSQQGFDSVTLAIGHLGHLIRSFVGDGSRWNMDITYASEDTPRGTIGPVLGILDRLPEHFLVMNGDILTDLDYADVLTHHRRGDAPLTVATCTREVRIDFGVLTTTGNRVVHFVEKPTIDYRVSMGVYGLSRTTLETYPPHMPFGFDDLVLDLLARGVQPAEYPFDGYWLDIGRPDDYDRANAEFDSIKGTLLKGA
ncbi:sugar phosphate nucleotidyltransferase [Streptomyces sp. NPDC000348]|uniref:sugar phosphate nucleotidyltransferase n=1 Tax=Streptomyces sp. NPDC000348 TaxID=3364538 RepID=UPI00369410F9